MVEKSCRKCGAKITQDDGPGRPADYCTAGCRRAAEHEVRRLNRALERTEDAARSHREHLAVRPSYGLSCCGGRELVERHLTFLEEECVRLDERLARLLGSES